MAKKAGRKSRYSDESFTQELKRLSKGKFSFEIKESTLNRTIDLNILNIGRAMEEAVYCILEEIFT